jgi:hypothetical protein
MNLNEWKFVGAGRTRIAVRRGNHVIKIPLNIDGIDDNLREAYIFAHRSSTAWSWARFARCKMVKGTHLLMMVYARCVVQGRTDDQGTVLAQSLPGWASNVDCRQVGFTRQGELVAYDYGR